MCVVVILIHFFFHLAGTLPAVTNTNTVDEDEITKNIRALKLQGSPRPAGAKGRRAIKSNKSSPASSPTLNE